MPPNTRVPPDPGAADVEQAIFRKALGLRRGRLPKSACETAAGDRALYATWRRYLADGDDRRMRAVLRRDGHWPSAVRRAKGATDIPSWAGTLRRLMAEAARPDAPPPGTAGTEPVPFADLLDPCRRVARALLDRALAEAGVSPAALLDPPALGDLERGLMRRLSEVASPSLYAAFDPLRTLSPLAGLLGPAAAPRAAYDGFVRGMLADGYVALFRRFPVLARSLSILVELWAEATAELLSRLAADRLDIARRFFADGTPSPVAAIRPGLSDPHAGGRTVARITFANGRALAYKPRSVDMEAGFSTLLDWANGLGLAHPHRVPAVLARDGYGWMEWVEPAPCRSERDASAFYWRAGSLFALYRALGGSDLHYENLVACGAHPVLVDVECLLHPTPAAPDETAGEAVLTTGFLPIYAFADDALRPVNFGALGPACGPRGLDETVFLNPGTDWLMRARKASAFPDTHLPRLAGRLLDPCDHAADLAAGYRESWAAILRHRDRLLDAPDSPLAGLRRAHGRYLARGTSGYGAMLQAACAPQAMADGVAFDLAFEPLRRSLDTLPDGFDALAMAERMELERLDVPRFPFAADDRHARDGANRPVVRLFAETPFESMARRLRAADDIQVARDVAMIARALHRPRPDALSPAALSPDSASPDAATAGEPTPRGLLHALADRLAGAAILDPDGTPRWVGLSSQPGTGLCTAPAGHGLYDGGPGIALFFAAAARALDDDRYGTLARKALRPTRAAVLGAQGGRLVARLGAGYGGGLGGMLCALGWCGALLDDEALLDDAVRMAGLARNALADDHAHDLLGGGAGLALGLLVLHGLTGRAELVEAAAIAGDHALAHARRLETGLGWPMRGGPALAGLSHGTSGFALALAHLHRATGEARWRLAAFDALRHERSLFDADAGNWPDLRPAAGSAAGASTDRRFMTAWCHGAPGIALGRLGVLAALEQDGDGMLSADLEAALETTRRHALQDTDDLCCGNAGRLDILRTAGRALGRRDLTETAMGGVTGRVGTVHAAGHCTCWHHRAGVLGDGPGLFKGETGFGYTLARALAPEIVPNVLLPVPEWV